MKVAVVTPIYNPKAEWLALCVESVKKQTYPCVHFLAFDGPIEKSLIPEESDSIKHLFLPGPHNDYGDTPRGLATICAFRLGFDAVAWLDADNWYLPSHTESLVSLIRSEGVSVATSVRDLYTLDGTLLGRCPEMEQNALIDTNCYLVTRAEATFVSLWWGMKDEFHKIGDRVMFKYLMTQGIRWASTGQSTVCYRTAFKAHYEYFGVAVPVDAKDGFTGKL